MLPLVGDSLDLGVGIMKFLHVCYVAFGFAVARWLFRREVVEVVDPVPRFRTSGLL
jgi:hypothetical protein